MISPFAGRKIIPFLLLAAAIPVLGLPVATGESELIANGDALSGPRTDPAGMQRALLIYEEARGMVPKGAEPCWKAARAAWWLGMQHDKNEDKQHYFKEGIAMAKEAIRRDPNAPEGYYWLGANEVFYGHLQGATTALSMVNSIRNSMKEVIYRNERYMGGGAYCVLGLLDTYLPRFVGGNKDRALQQFDRSLTIEPHNPLTLCALADYYVKVGKKTEARAALDKLDQMDPPADLEFELLIMRQQGRKLRQKL